MMMIRTNEREKRDANEEMRKGRTPECELEEMRKRRTPSMNDLTTGNGKWVSEWEKNDFCTILEKINVPA